MHLCRLRVENYHLTSTKGEQELGGNDHLLNLLVKLVGSDTVHFVPCLDRVGLLEDGEDCAVFMHLDSGDLLLNEARHIAQIQS